MRVLYKFIDKIEDFLLWLTLKKATTELKNERIEECYKCIYRNPSFKLWFFTIKDKSQCDVCKCLINNKAGLLYEICPKNKWKH